MMERLKYSPAVKKGGEDQMHTWCGSEPSRSSSVACAWDQPRLGGTRFLNDVAAEKARDPRRDQKPDSFFFPH